MNYTFVIEVKLLDIFAKIQVLNTWKLTGEQEGENRITHKAHEYRLQMLDLTVINPSARPGCSLPVHTQTLDRVITNANLQATKETAGFKFGVWF